MQSCIKSSDTGNNKKKHKQILYQNMLLSETVICRKLNEFLIFKIKLFPETISFKKMLFEAPFGSSICTESREILIILLVITRNEIS